MKTSGMLFLLIISFLLTDCKRNVSETTALISPPLTIAVTPTGEMNFHALAVGTNDGLVIVHNAIIDEQKRELYVTGLNNVAVIDLDTQTVKRFIKTEIGGFLLSYDSGLYIAEAGGQRFTFYSLDLSTGATTSIASTDALRQLLSTYNPREATYGGYSFSDVGYTIMSNGRIGVPVDWRQDLNAAYGVIEITDENSVKQGEIIHGPDALYIAIDGQTGTLYAVNTGDASISVFDISRLSETNFCEHNSCKVKDIRLGASAEQLIMDASGNAFVRSRLGGSSIYKCSVLQNKCDQLRNENIASQGESMWIANNWSGGGIGLWPSAMDLSKDRTRLFVQSHYGARVDIVDAQTFTVTGEIKFDISLPRSDSISTMAVDKTRNRIYAAFPDSGTIGVGDGTSGQVFGLIDLSAYGFDRYTAANQSELSLISLAVDETANRVFVYLDQKGIQCDQGAFCKGKLLMFNGDDTSAAPLETDVIYDTQRLSRTEPGMLTYNASTNELYLGYLVIDPATLSIKNEFSAGQWVVGINGNDVYLADIATAGSGQSRGITLFHYHDGSLTESILLGASGKFSPGFYFDFTNRTVYLAYPEEATVRSFNLP
jgi:DNA-binding beta-propeller fold protein YncE